MTLPAESSGTAARGGRQLPSQMDDHSRQNPAYRPAYHLFFMAPGDGNRCRLGAAGLVPGTS